jgi:hypothetical protein
MGTVFFVLAVICSASWIATAVFFWWMEKREKKSDTRIQIKINKV